MERILSNIKKMNSFQKLQVLSAIVPYASCLFVIITTYIVCWKKKLSFIPYIICSFVYFALFSLTINLINAVLLKFAVCFFICLVGNYCLVYVQIRER